MQSIRIVFLWGLVQYLTFLISSVNGASVSNETESNATDKSNSTGSDSVDDRLNLNFNVAGAHGFGKQGGYSQSNAASHAIKAGISRPGGHYQNLYENSGATSNGYSSGPGAPLTFANAGSRTRPGYAGGNAGAGVLGGQGSSFAQSINQNYAIPLDNQGTVLLSNLPERSNSTQPSSNSSSEEKTTPASTDKKKEPEALVFS